MRCQTHQLVAKPDVVPCPGSSQRPCPSNDGVSRECNTGQMPSWVMVASSHGHDGGGHMLCTVIRSYTGYPTISKCMFQPRLLVWHDSYMVEPQKTFIGLCSNPYMHGLNHGHSHWGPDQIPCDNPIGPPYLPITAIHSVESMCHKSREVA